MSGILCFRYQDLWGAALFLMLLLHRFTSIDFSSLWQTGILLTLYLLFRQTNEKQQRYAAYGLILWGIVEAVVACFQKAGLMESWHHFFDVTGTFANPGPLGGFLSISLVGAVSLSGKHLLELKRSTASFVLLLSSLVSLYGLVLSESRAGWVAALSGIGVLWIPRIRRNVFPRIGMYILGAIITCIAVWGFYQMRTDSANGRLLIWWNTLAMIQEHPLFGTGTGGWLANYMHYQAAYFTRHPDSPFVLLADNVAYPYNEYLHLWTEQGLIGIMLLFLLGHTCFRSESPLTLKAQLCAWAVFAFFSYPSDVFVLQAVGISFTGMTRSKPIGSIRWNNYRCMYAGMLLGCILCLSGISWGVYYKVREQIKQPISVKRASDLQRLYPYFCHNAPLMTLYSQACTRNPIQRDWTFQVCTQAAQVFPVYELYCEMGDSYQSQGEFARSEQCYQTAMRMVPNRVTPTYKLFKLYANQGKKDEALITADRLLRQPIKKEGTRTLEMKAEAGEYLRLGSKR